MSIDPALSEKYGIADYGAQGFEVQRGGRQVAVFNSTKDRALNWACAVEWAETHPDDVAPLPRCGCGLCAIIADGMTEIDQGAPAP